MSAFRAENDAVFCLYASMEGEVGDTAPVGDTFWTADQALAEVALRDGVYAVRMKIHQDEEAYGARHSEILPIDEQSGTRRYLMVQLYILVPDLHMTVELFPQPAADGAMGNMAAIQWRGMNQLPIGKGQAWYYPTDRLIILWELDLDTHILTSPHLALQPERRALWVSLERMLWVNFPAAERIGTPAWDPTYSTPAWQALLLSLGYHAESPTAWTKGRA